MKFSFSFVLISLMTAVHPISKSIQFKIMKTKSALMCGVFLATLFSCQKEHYLPAKLKS